MDKGKKKERTMRYTALSKNYKQTKNIKLPFITAQIYFCSKISENSENIF